MSETPLRRGQLPPIPEGSGILPIAENRIARGPQPEILDLPPEDFVPSSSSVGLGMEGAPRLNDRYEMECRRILARALALAGIALLSAAAVSSSLGPVQATPAVMIAVRALLLVQVIASPSLTRWVERMEAAPAGLLLAGYALGCGLEFSYILPGTGVALGFLCAGLMYLAVAGWGLAFRADLGGPWTLAGLLAAGAAALAVSGWLGHLSWWSLVAPSALVMAFLLLAMYFAQRIRDLYQEYGDGEEAGWKASVVGGLILVLNLLLRQVGARALYSSED